MYHMLKPGQQVLTHYSKKTYEIEQFLGAGVQGEVYRAKLVDTPVIQESVGMPSNNWLLTWLNAILGFLERLWKHHSSEDTASTQFDSVITFVALKWYFPESATPEQHLALERLVKRGAPTIKFLWPLDLVSTPDASGFGYIMTLREERYKSLSEWMKRSVDLTFRTLIQIGLELAESYFQLHIQGWCYRDISINNVSFDPATGEVLIGDTDNVAVNGAIYSAVLGTLDFMAPEIIRKEALPNTQTDLYSLSVLFFHMFMIHHPLKGKKEADHIILDQDALIQIYGTEPLFIFDPNDLSNSPEEGYQNNPLLLWPLYPQFLRDLFIRAFTIGIRDPDNRITEGEWRAAFVHMRDSIFCCCYCSKENFYDINALKTSTSNSICCWYCKRKLRLPPRIRLDNNREKIVVVLNEDTKLFPHHIFGKKYDFSRPVAEVVRHQTGFGIKNLSNEKWVITGFDGTMHDIELGMSVPLIEGIKILFGSIQGEIRI